MKVAIAGRYRDLIEGRQGRLRLDSGWRSNRVVARSSVLLAALMKRQEGMAGILYWAVGQGEAAWDSRLPSPRAGDTRLTSEVARQALPPEGIIYLDAAGRPTETPTNRLEITAEFTDEDLVTDGFQPLREFGLFGGDATATPDTGLLIDRVIHPRIDLSPGDTLRRTLQLSFINGGVTGAAQELGDFGAQFPVASIDGIGERFGATLASVGVETLGELARLDPLRILPGIPPVRLREFQTKARMVLGMKPAMEEFGNLAEWTVTRVLRTPPTKLAAATEDPNTTAKDALDFQDQLAVLQVALDETTTQQLRVADLETE